jgi:heme o synthase
MSKISTYLELTKPGLVRGNLLTTAAGFFLAATAPLHTGLLLYTLIGISLVVGAGCVINNYRDRDIDARMERTRARALVSGKILPTHALIFGGVLLLVGLGTLWVYANWIATVFALLGFIIYVFWYTPAKRTTLYATHIGSLAGAMPPVVGYTAASGILDWGVLAIFLILVLWQMPHFFSIAIYRSRDYAAAQIPVLPIVRGLRTAKKQISLYIVAFAVAATLPYLLGLVGDFYLYAVLGVTIVWFLLALKGFLDTNSERWARKMFVFSLLVLMVLCVAIFASYFA